MEPSFTYTFLSFFSELIDILYLQYRHRRKPLHSPISLEYKVVWKSASVRVYTDDDKTIADRFNQFFTSVGENVSG